MTHGLLDKRALGVSRAEKGHVDKEEKNASLGEGQNSQGQAEQQRHLEPSDEIHAGIVVLLDKSSNGVCQRTGSGLGSTRRGGRRGSGALGGRLQSGDQVGARVCRNVEDRVDAKGEEGQWDLAGIEPDNRHSKILDIFITSELHRNVRNATLKTTTGNMSLVHHDTICRSRRKESQAVGHLGRGRVVVEGDVGQEIAEDGEQQGDVPSKPSKL